MFMSTPICAAVIVRVRESACVYVSPLDGLLCLVCMVNVPTTAPIFAVVVVAARLCTEVCVSLARVFKAGRYSHGLSPPSTHPPPSALSRTPIPVLCSFMLFHTTSHGSSPSLAFYSPFLPPYLFLLLSLPLSATNLEAW